ncbi:hypothetical protein MMC30_009097 [Trapelia coarctata]|nr:hypothetical protein [Trapelia coarctata]
MAEQVPVWLPDPEPQGTRAQRLARIEKWERLIEAEEVEQRRRQTRCRQARRRQEIVDLRNDWPSASDLRGRGRRTGSLPLDPHATLTGSTVFSERGMRRHTWWNAEEAQRGVDDQLQRELELAVFLARRHRREQARAQIKSWAQIILTNLLFLFILWVWFNRSLLRLTPATPFSNSDGPIILNAMTAFTHGNTLLDALPYMTDLSHSLVWIGTAISDLAVFVDTSQLSLRKEIGSHLEGFRVLHDEMSDLLLERNAAAQMIVNLMIFQNQRTSLLLHHFADQSNGDSSTRFIQVLDKIDAFAAVIEDELGRVFQHDLEILQTLQSSRKELESSKRAFARDAVIVQQTRNQVIQDRDLWAICFIAAGGTGSDMGLVERNIDTLQRIEYFFPQLEANFSRNAHAMREGLQALRTFRGNIRVYRRLQQEQRLEEPSRALIRASTQALDRKHEEMEIGAAKVAKHRRERRQLFQL